MCMAHSSSSNRSIAWVTVHRNCGHASATFRLIGRGVPMYYSLSNLGPQFNILWLAFPKEDASLWSPYEGQVLISSSPINGVMMQDAPMEVAKAVEHNGELQLPTPEQTAMLMSKRRSVFTKDLSGETVDRHAPPVSPSLFPVTACGAPVPVHEQSQYGRKFPVLQSILVLTQGILPAPTEGGRHPRLWPIFADHHQIGLLCRFRRL